MQVGQPEERQMKNDGTRRTATPLVLMRFSKPTRRQNNAWKRLRNKQFTLYLLVNQYFELFYNLKSSRVKGKDQLNQLNYIILVVFCLLFHILLLVVKKKVFRINKKIYTFRRSYSASCDRNKY